jgi:acetyl esterase/lipase
MGLLDRTPLKADQRLTYGTSPQQFGDLWIPGGDSTKQLSVGHSSSAKRWPLIVFLHGGWWSAGYGLDYAGFLCQAMKAHGIAVWSLEYRRVGDVGGGWPGTMQDAAAGMDHVTKLAETFPLDTSRVIAAGHSAGAQLAFWLAARHHVPHNSVLAEPQPNLGLKGVVSLAGAVDLKLTIELGGFFSFTNGPPAVRALMGGTPSEVPERYAAADPAELLPLGVPQILVQGTEDDQIPPTMPGHWQQAAQRQGDHVEVKIVSGADHFDVVDPESPGWAMSRDALLKLLHT